jgi:hypothetical protein
MAVPPADKAKLNRANRAGRPMFYCSVGAPAVFYELRAKQGDRIALNTQDFREFMIGNALFRAAAKKSGPRRAGRKSR